jgi:hypothetical protein
MSWIAMPVAPESNPKALNVTFAARPALPLLAQARPLARAFGGTSRSAKPSNKLLGISDTRLDLNHIAVGAHFRRVLDVAFAADSE